MGFVNNLKNKPFFQKFFRNMQDYSTKQVNFPKIDYIEGQPYFNTSFAEANSLLYQQMPYNYREIMSRIKSSPEMLSILNAVVIDVVSDGYKFIPVEKQGSKSNLKRAEEWAKKNHFKKQMKPVLTDFLWAGNGLAWFKLDATSSMTRIKEIVEIHNQANIEYKEAQVNIEQIQWLTKQVSIPIIPQISELEAKQIYDEEFNKYMTFRHIPWTTVIILHDNTTILGYQQNVGTSGPIVNVSGQPIEGKYNSTNIPVRIWPASQVIHFTFMPLDGKPYAYTPVIAAIPTMSILSLLKNYVGEWFEQGGVPDTILVFKNVGVGETAVTKFKQTMETYKKAYKRRGVMIAQSPGDFDKIDLNGWNKDMEYRKLAIYCTSVLAAIFQMPLARLQSILGMEIKGGPSDTADAAYWRTIAEIQSSIELDLNTQLFEPEFGVNIKFNNAYVQDDIRRGQVEMQRQDILAKKMDNLARAKRKFKEDALISFINGEKDLVEKEDLEKMTPEDLGLGQEGITGNRQGQTKQKDVDETRSKKKKAEQDNKTESTKLNPQDRNP